jgi:hypothetical protein
MSQYQMQRSQVDEADDGWRKQQEFLRRRALGLLGEHLPNTLSEVVLAFIYV